MCKNFIIFYFDVLIVEDDMILGLKQMLGDYYGCWRHTQYRKKGIDPPHSLLVVSQLYLCLLGEQGAEALSFQHKISLPHHVWLDYRYLGSIVQYIDLTVS